MKMEVYTPEEIIHVIDILENVQDIMATKYGFEEAWDMLEESIQILAQEAGEAE